MSGRRRLLLLAAACGAGAVVVATALTGAALVRSDDTVELAPLVAGWNSHWQVTGAKSEPLYTERIDVRRDGDAFQARIEVIGQGDTALGTQLSAVSVDAAGTIAWTEGCTKSAADCADDPQLRGFLATAALISLDRQGRLPATGTARTLHGTPVVCVSDAALHPDAAAADVRLDPCFDRATGAVLAHWSPDSAAFVGATLAPGFTVSTS